MKTEILPASDRAALQKAAAVLKRGGLVAFPTETVYGLGADAFNPEAVSRLFEAKKRPAFDPLIVHLSARDQTSLVWKNVPKAARALMDRFWPGPLTLVLPKTGRVPDIVTAGLPTVGARIPNHAAALEFLAVFGSPVAAPSANVFGRTSPTTAEAVAEDLGERIDLILDGGPTAVGVESTVLKIGNGTGILLRPGGIPFEALAEFLPVKKEGPPSGGTAAESPGRLAVHYAPWTPLTLMDRPFREFSKEIIFFQKMYGENKIPWPRIGLLLFKKQTPPAGFEAVETLSAEGRLPEAAANLFQAIRKLDKMNFDLLVAEPVPDTGLGAAIMDRLKKASAGNTGIKSFLKT